MEATGRSLIRTAGGVQSLGLSLAAGILSLLVVMCDPGNLKAFPYFLVPDEYYSLAPFLGETLGKFLFALTYGVSLWTLFSINIRVASVTGRSVISVFLCYLLVGYVEYPTVSSGRSAELIASILVLVAFAAPFVVFLVLVIRTAPPRVPLGSLASRGHKWMSVYVAICPLLAGIIALLAYSRGHRLESDYSVAAMAEIIALDLSAYCWMLACFLLLRGIWQGTAWAYAVLSRAFPWSATILGALLLALTHTDYLYYYARGYRHILTAEIILSVVILCFVSVHRRRSADSLRDKHRTDVLLQRLESAAHTSAGSHRLHRCNHRPEGGEGNEHQE